MPNRHCYVSWEYGNTPYKKFCTTKRLLKALNSLLCHRQIASVTTGGIRANKQTWSFVAYLSPCLNSSSIVGCTTRAMSVATTFTIIIWLPERMTFREQGKRNQTFIDGTLATLRRRPKAIPNRYQWDQKQN